MPEPPWSSGEHGLVIQSMENSLRPKNQWKKKPASTAALEKYLGSGLIKGVGPVTAKKIVFHFKDKTMDVFENNIEALTSVPGIATKKTEADKKNPGTGIVLSGTL